MTHIKMVFCVDDTPDAKALWDMGQALAATGFCSRQFMPGHVTPTDESTEVYDLPVVHEKKPAVEARNTPSGYTKDHTGLGDEMSACSLAMRRGSGQTHTNTDIVGALFRLEKVKSPPRKVMLFLSSLGFLRPTGVSPDGVTFFAFTDKRWDDERPRIYDSCKEAIMAQYLPGRTFVLAEAALWAYHGGFDPASASPVLSSLVQSGEVERDRKREPYRFPMTRP